MSDVETGGKLPGEELVQKGISDLAQGELTEEALLVLIAAPRLRNLGIEIPDVANVPRCEHRLYERLEERLGTGAHSYYNGLVRRIVSFSHALEREHERSGK
jgi:hypothetical protein